MSRKQEIGLALVAVGVGVAAGGTARAAGLVIAAGVVFVLAGAVALTDRRPPKARPLRSAWWVTARIVKFPGWEIAVGRAELQLPSLVDEQGPEVNVRFIVWASSGPDAITYGHGVLERAGVEVAHTGKVAPVELDDVLLAP